MKTFVIDASVILSYILPDEKPSKEIKSLFDDFKNKKAILQAPRLLKIEVANALRSAVISKRMPKKLSLAIFKEFNKTEITYNEPDLIKTLELALKHHLSVYDSTYLALAKAKKAPLITLDKNLRKL